jgi:signal transduction histidine kinase
VLTVGLATTLGAGALGAHNGWLILIVAFFNAVLHGRRWAAIGSLVIGYCVSVRGTSLAFALGLLAGLVALLSVAELTRAWRQRTAAEQRGREEAVLRRASEERLAGLAVSLLSEGETRSLPAGVDAAAYRIIQEALTNAVRHSGGSAATVRLRHYTERVEILVEDDGRGSVAAGAGASGNGLVGMAERARALGGTLDAGPRPGGGFRVLARIPADVTVT